MDHSCEYQVLLILTLIPLVICGMHTLFEVLERHENARPPVRQHLK